MIIRIRSTAYFQNKVPLFDSISHDDVMDNVNDDDDDIDDNDDDRDITWNGYDDKTMFI